MTIFDFEDGNAKNKYNYTPSVNPIFIALF